MELHQVLYVPARKIDWTMCELHRPRGHRIVFLNLRENLALARATETRLFQLDTMLMGFPLDMSEAGENSVALQMFRLMVDLHNKSFSLGRKRGTDSAKQEIRTALGLGS